MLVLAIFAGIATGFFIQRTLGSWAAAGGSLHVLALLSASFSGSVCVALLVYLVGSLRPGASSGENTTRWTAPIEPCRRCQGRRFDGAGTCRTCGLPRPRYRAATDRAPRPTGETGAHWYVKALAVLAILSVFGGGAFLATSQGLAAGPANALPGLVISSPTASPTRTPTATRTATATGTPTPTWTPTRTPSATPTETPTETPTTTPTASPTITPTATVVITPTAGAPVAGTPTRPAATTATTATTATALPALPTIAPTQPPAPAQGATPLPTLPPVGPNGAPRPSS